MAYIKPDGSYYEGDREHALDVEVPQRPSPDHDWDGAAWVLNAARAAEKHRQADLDTAITGDAQLAAFKAMSNAEFDTWWAANVTNAAQAIAVLKRLAKLVIRRVL